MVWFPSILDLTASPKEKVNKVSKHKPRNPCNPAGSKLYRRWMKARTAERMTYEEAKTRYDQLKLGESDAEVAKRTPEASGQAPA
jgi:hypothetical protein